MKLNLTGAQRVIEDLMQDECEITRDAEGTADDTWDPVTGTYTPPEDDVELIYAGQCLVSNRGGGSTREEGGQYLTHSPYTISLPLDAPELIKKDRVLIVGSNQDPDLADKDFLIDEPLFSSFAVSRRATMHRNIPTPGAS